MKKVLFSVLVMALGSFATANTLGLTPTKPDIFSSKITVLYNSTSDTLTATGKAISIDMSWANSYDYDLLNSSFSLTAIINDSGQIAGGSLAISGNVYDENFVLQPSSGVLLTGTLRQFGFDEVAPISPSLEFVFDTTGGSFAPFYPQIGVILNNSGYTGSFSSDFNNIPLITNAAPQGNADAFSVPTPAALPAGLILLGLLAAIRFRKMA